MDAPYTLSLEEFWNWMSRHNNCILRAGTPDAVFYDSELFHWHFGNERGMLNIQILQGKLLVGELFLDTESIDYVQSYPSENSEEHTFELISETESDRFPRYVFIMAHPFEQEDHETVGRIH